MRSKAESFGVKSYLSFKEIGHGLSVHDFTKPRKRIFITIKLIINFNALQASVADAAGWALGEGPALAEPNYKAVVPSADKE